MVTLRKRKNKDGSTSLRLDIYYDGIRRVETLKLKLIVPRTAQDREYNRRALRDAQSIALQRSREIEAGHYNLSSNPVVAEWMQEYIDSYTKKDKRNLQGALNKFIECNGQITFNALTPAAIDKYIDHLESNQAGEGAKSYFNRFNKMVKHAYKIGMIRVNPILQTDKKVRGRASKRDILTLDEVRKLKNTTMSNDHVRRAALLSCVTGLAWVDVRELRWEHIRDGKVIKVREKLMADNVEVVVPLNDTAIELLGVRGEGYVFNLPSANGANKLLKGWVKRAGIGKKITWHNLRHSFGTNLIYNGVDLLTTSKLLGHQSTKHTMRYVDAAEDMKSNAVKKIEL